MTRDDISIRWSRLAADFRKAPKETLYAAWFEGREFVPATSPRTSPEGRHTGTVCETWAPVDGSETWYFGARYEADYDGGPRVLHADGYAAVQPGGDKVRLHVCGVDLGKVWTADAPALLQDAATRNPGMDPTVVALVVRYLTEYARWTGQPLRTVEEAAEHASRIARKAGECRRQGEAYKAERAAAKAEGRPARPYSVVAAEHPDPFA